MFFLSPHRYRWIILLVASYYFYMSWNVNYVFLIFFTTLVSYVTAILIDREERHFIRKIYLIISLVASLGVLFFYKYFNFFGSSINDMLEYSGSNLRVPYLSILLPVGISFYTFQTLSYTIDVYKGEKDIEKHFGIYALYVSFFPQLVAGPIERSLRLLPQFHSKHFLNLNNFIEGTKWIIIGYFMKLVVADRLSLYVNAVYNNPEHHNGTTFVLATVLFAFQIYGDFAGYSGIAIGVAKLMGFDLMVNFNRPYFANSIGDFWKRWHISLSTWFRDYFYIPLGGNRVSKHRWYINLFLTFVVSGLWHGANWTFIIWGALHGFYLILENVFNLSLKKKHIIGKFRYLMRAFIVFVLVNFAWIFFRANNVSDAFFIVKNIFLNLGEPFIDQKTLFYGFIGIVLLLINDYIAEKNPETFIFGNKLNFISIVYFTMMTIAIFYLGVFSGGQFIYFQF